MKPIVWLVRKLALAAFVICISVMVNVYMNGDFAETLTPRTPDLSGDRVASGDEKEPEDPSMPVWGRIGGDLKTKGQKGQSELIFTIEQLDQLKENMPPADKWQVLLLFEDVPQEVIQTISTYLEGGLTAEELAETENLLKQSLSEEKYEELLALFEKY